MKIRTKIALQFTAIIAVILSIFAVSSYYLAEQNRKEEFYKRLRDQATEKASLLIKLNTNKINKRLLKIIDRETLTKLYAEKILMFNEKDKLIYSSFKADSVRYSQELLQEVRKKKYVETTNENLDVVGVMFTDSKKGEFVMMASADDYLGKSQLQKLRNSLIISVLFGILFTVVLGFIFAGQSLKPITEMNREVSSITAYNLKKKLNEGNRQDEIAQLAINFNQMLQRLEQSFDLQKSFVSNASHELRTPLAALKSEIQVSLESARTPEEYQKILQFLLTDTQRLIQLTNGLLQLAQSENKEPVKFQSVRIDELLFQTQEELQYQHSDYQIIIDFDAIPENEQSITVSGNETLLKTVFNNLIDNACKYSANKRAEVRINFDEQNCKIRVIDQGIGIPANEIKRVFEPLHRAPNATTFKGYGIGLSVCRRIIDMHRGQILVLSELEKGSTFEVILPNIT